MLTKELRAKRAKLVADARAVLDAADAEKREMTAEETATYDAALAEADGVFAKIERMERLDDAEKSLNARVERQASEQRRSVDQISDEEREETDAYNAWLRGGMNALSAEHRAIASSRISTIKNAQGVGSNTGGGYTVPTGFYDQLVDAEKAYGGMLIAGNTINTESGDTLPIPTDNDTTNSGALLSENTQVTAQDVTFGSVTLNAYMYTSKLVLVSIQLLNDSAFDLNTFLANKLGTRIARAINTHFTTGDGAAKPYGAVNAATSGKVGATGESTSLIYDDLFDLEHSVDPAYRVGPKVGFMMSDSTLKAIKKLKDGQGRYLWNAGIGEKSMDTINGYKYTINQDMAAMAANAKSVLFGDFSYYWMRRVAGAQVLRLTERYADYAQVGFLAFQRWDGTLIDAGTHPLAYFANSAS